MLQCESWKSSVLLSELLALLHSWCMDQISISIFGPWFLCTICMQSSLLHWWGGGGGFEQCRHRRGNKSSSSSYGLTLPSPTTFKAQPLPLYLCVIGTASICKQMHGGRWGSQIRRQQKIMCLFWYLTCTIYLIPFWPLRLHPRKESKFQSFCSQILSPSLRDIDTGIELLYRPASLCSLVSRYDNPMPESTISPRQGLRLCPQHTFLFKSYISFKKMCV